MDQLLSIWDFFHTPSWPLIWLTVAFDWSMFAFVLSFVRRGSHKVDAVSSSAASSPTPRFRETTLGRNFRRIAGVMTETADMVDAKPRWSDQLVAPVVGAFADYVSRKPVKTVGGER